MSVLYYCDAPNCVNKAPGQGTPEGWTGPVGWKYNIDDDGQVDACSDAHLDEAIKRNQSNAAHARSKQEKEEADRAAEEETEASAETE